MKKDLSVTTNLAIVEDIAWLAETHLKILLKLPDYKDERKGGYLVVADAITGMPVVVIRVGEVPLEKYDKYLTFALEKARRAFEGHQHDATIVSSWQTRNPDENKWGGAVLGKHWLVSFSGLPELADEAFSASIATSLPSPMPKSHAHRIGKRSSNPFMKPLLYAALR